MSSEEVSLPVIVRRLKHGPAEKVNLFSFNTKVLAYLATFLLAQIKQLQIAERF